MDSSVACGELEVGAKQLSTVAAVDHSGRSAGDAEQCDGETVKTRRLWAGPVL